MNSGMLLKCLFYSVSATLPSGQLSNIPWRRTGVKYTNNEAYFDIVEEVDAIIDKSGSTVFAEIQGYVSCTKRMNRSVFPFKEFNLIPCFDYRLIVALSSVVCLILHCPS